MSGKLELVGLGLTGGSIVFAQPEGVAAGLTLTATGGVGSIGAGLAQFSAGILQGLGGGGYSNAFSAVATLGTGATISRFIGGPSATGYLSASQRSTDSLFKNAAIVSGGAYDTMTSFLDDLAPHQTSCGNQ